MTHAGRAVRRTQKAVWINAICLFLVVGFSSIGLAVYEVYQHAGAGFGVFAALATLWALYQEWCIRRQIRLMRFGQVTTATITGAWTIRTRYPIHIRTYRFVTASGKTINRITRAGDLDSIIMLVGYQLA